MIRRWWRRKPQLPDVPIPRPPRNAEPRVGFGHSVSWVRDEGLEARKPLHKVRRSTTKTLTHEEFRALVRVLNPGLRDDPDAPYSP